MKSNPRSNHKRFCCLPLKSVLNVLHPCLIDEECNSLDEKVLAKELLNDSYSLPLNLGHVHFIVAKS